MKRIVALFLTLVIVLGLLPVTAPRVHATEGESLPAEESTKVTVEVSLEDLVDLPSNEELFSGYVEQVFYGNTISTFGTSAGNRLQGDDKALYNALVSLFQDVAAGNRASTVITIGKTVYNTADGTLVPEVMRDFSYTTDNVRDRVFTVLRAVLSDRPYEQYWCDKTSGCYISYYIDQDWEISYLEFNLSVVDNFQGASNYEVDTAKTSATAKAAANAKSIVKKYASLSDYEKLLAYKNEICSLVEYDYTAYYSGNFSQNANPWQLLNVFDGNEDTNVVCEGYSKAFMYLCDLSTFSGDVACQVVSGVAGGPHMWNIVTINDKNYMVDVTNSDSGTIGQDGSLFLVGATGDIYDGYVFTRSDQRFTYDSDAYTLWGTDADSILWLESTDYSPAKQEGDWSYLIENGAATIIKYTGKDAQVTVPGKIGGYEVRKVDYHAFWNNSTMQSLILSEGIRTLSKEWIGKCSALEEIHYSSTVRVETADTNPVECGKLKKISVSSKNPNITVYNNDLYSKDKAQLLYHPAGDSRDTVEIPKSVVSIFSGAFRGCKKLSKVIFRGSAAGIGVDAFAGTTATVYYPTGNGWKQSLRKDYGGTLTWVVYGTVKAPKNVTATNKMDTGKPYITWDETANALKYQVYRADSASGTYKRLTTTANTYYTDKNAVTGKQYYYKIKAVNALDEVSDLSDYATRTCDLPRPVISSAGTVASSGNPKISWNAIDGAKGYTVYRKVSGGEYKKLDTVTSKSYTDKTAKVGTKYYYAVVAVHEKTTSANSAKSKAKACTADLKRPQITVSNKASSGKPTISWSAIDGAKEYAVYRKVSGGEYKKIGTTSSKSYTDTTAKAGTKYYYAVTAVHTNSSANSAKSEAKTRIADLAQPKVKVSNTASSGKVKLSWEQVSGASKYYVYRATSKSGEYKKIKSTTSTSFSDSDARVGKTYYYKVKAIYTSNTDANSAYSSVVSGMRDLTRPDVSVKLSSKKPKLSWEKVSSASKYYVYRATSEKGEYTKISSTTSTSYTDKTAKTGKTYYYKVKAIYSSNTSANSAYSSVDKIKVN